MNFKLKFIFFIWVSEWFTKKNIHKKEDLINSRKLAHWLTSASSKIYRACAIKLITSFTNANNNYANLSRVWGFVVRCSAIGSRGLIRNVAQSLFDESKFGVILRLKYFKIFLKVKLNHKVHYEFIKI